MAGVAHRAPGVRRIARVLVATDLWADSARVVAYAYGIVRPGGVVRLAHVAHPRSIAAGAFETTIGRFDRHEQYVRALEQRLDALRPRAARRRRLRVETRVIESANPVRAICQEAERFHADVVVVGSRGAGLSKSLLGSVARGIVAKSPRPVFVVDPREK